jgi:hypothetical protein
MRERERERHGKMKIEVVLCETLMDKEVTKYKAIMDS